MDQLFERILSRLSRAGVQGVNGGPGCSAAAAVTERMAAEFQSWGLAWCELSFCELSRAEVVCIGTPFPRIFEGQSGLAPRGVFMGGDVICTTGFLYIPHVL